MGNTLKVDEIKSELVRYVKTRPDAFQGALLSKDVFLNKYTRLITKVNGEYPSVQALMTHVVQAFYSKKFTPFGEIIFKKKDLRTFRQKVDFELDPAEILGTLYADFYDEGKNPKDKTISKKAIDMLLEIIIDDVNILSVNGKYDATKVGADTPVFGASMDGLNEVIAQTRLDTNNPAYMIPGDAITSSNILQQITAYEKNLPALAKPKIKYIFTSDEDVEEYQEAYDDTFGARPNYKDGDAVKTRFGKRELVGIPGLAKGTVFSTPQNNFLRLVDIVENPATITDIQVFNRILKVLGEFSLAYNFGINQILYLHTPDGTKNLGLNDTAQNKLFYPGESKIA